jgi:hypothetical protein
MFMIETGVTNACNRRGHPLQHRVMKSGELLLGEGQGRQNEYEHGYTG